MASAGAAATPVMSRRREKRQLASLSSIDLQDPFQVLQLAVRMDESSSEHLLKEPLRFHHPPEKDFCAAISFLESQTSRSRSQTRKKLTTMALTPVILSGLIAAQQAREQNLHDADSSNRPNLPTASELVFYCNAMRRQALQRVNQRKRRRKLSIIAVIFGLGVVTVAAFLRKMSDMEQVMVELGYTALSSTQNDLFSNGLQPCVWMECNQDVCHFAEANLWAYFRDYATQHSAEQRDCTRRRCSRDSRNIMRRQLFSIPGRVTDLEYGQGPYAMHTIATREVVMWKNTRSKGGPWWAPEEDGGRVKKGLQWLGDTTVNQLVREHLLRIANTRKGGSKDNFRVLDVGCAIGGTLYALTGTAEDRWVERNVFDQLYYTGIAISSAEIMIARRLAVEHGMGLENIRFEQMSYDSASLRDLGEFSAVIAIESLSFSRNILNTLSNLASVMKPGGILIIVDDAIHTPRGDRCNMTQVLSRIEAYSRTSSRPSLLTHSKWMKALKDSGFAVKETMDLGLSYVLPQLGNGNHLTRTFSWRSWLPRAFRCDEQRDVFLRPLQIWESWIRACIDEDQTMMRDNQGDFQKPAQLHTIQLLQDNIRFLRSKALRKEEHELLDLTYNMYVCTKH